MLYFIMCGGVYQAWETPKQLFKINGETLVQRTIRLLQDNGIKKEHIIITTNNDYFDNMDISVLKFQNNWKVGEHGDVKSGYWVEGFLTTETPVCYLFGDVVYSPAAIKTIVEKKTQDIDFFASSPPFSPKYTKPWAEPFAFKVVNTNHFYEALDQTRRLCDQGKFKRHPIAWELWQVIKDTPLNKIDYKNYIIINDYTCDIDYPEDVEKIMEQMK